MASAEEVRDALLKLDTVVRGEEFQSATKAFVSEHNGMFEFTDENKLEYTDIHAKYQEQVEDLLSSNLSDSEIEAVMTGMSTIMSADNAVDIDRNVSESIDVLHAVSDFEFFKDMMLTSKREGSLADEDMTGSKGVTGFGIAEYDFMFEEMKQHGDDSGGWKTVSEKSWFRIEDKKIADKQYSRFTAVMDLKPEQVMDAFRLDNPAAAEWFPIMKSCEILKEYSPSDRVARVHTSMERFMGMVSGMPSHFDVRVISRPDFPEEGCTCLGQLGWDIDTEQVKATKIFKVRTILARPHPDDPDRSTVVMLQEAFMGWMPSWLRNSMISSVGPRMFNHVMVSYKQAKGIKA
mmetsp:Transcript_26490/g.68082  ORF Transcript_26490/g.68082 Transcript_26490/m.68082 type:complete len:348 (-) Transcript_26490:317-1360(-)